MNKDKQMRVALLFGGKGREHDISERSAAPVARALSPLCDLYTVGITTEGDFYLYSGNYSNIENGTWCNDTTHLFPAFFVRQGRRRGLLVEDTLLPVDVALPVLHGDFGEDGRIQGLLDVVGIPYVGAPVLAGALCTNKAMTKIIAEHLSVPTVPWCTLSPNTPFAEAKLQIRAALGRDEYPLIMKPICLGSSIGIFVVDSDDALRDALEGSRTFGDMLVERFLPGVREVEVCYLGLREDYFFSAEVNIPRTEQNSPYTYEKKYKTKAPAVKTTDLFPEIKGTLFCYASALVRTLGLCDLARLDFFLDENGCIYFNEINTFPGFSEQSFYPQVLKKNGFDYKTLLLSLLEVAYGRSV